MENVFEVFTITVLKLNKLVQKIKNYEMREYGLKTIHVMCIYYLLRRPEGITASELTKVTLEDKAAISRALKTLREKEYISYDLKKYGSLIQLTDSGRELAALIAKKAEKAVNAGSYDFTDDERVSFYDELQAISLNLENYYNSLTEH